MHRMGRSRNQCASIPLDQIQLNPTKPILTFEQMSDALLQMHSAEKWAETYGKSKQDPQHVYEGVARLVRTGVEAWKCFEWPSVVAKIPHATKATYWLYLISEYCGEEWLYLQLAGEAADFGEFVFCEKYLQRLGLIKLHLVEDAAIASSEPELLEELGAWCHMDDMKAKGKGTGKPTEAARRSQGKNR